MACEQTRLGATAVAIGVIALCSACSSSSSPDESAGGGNSAGGSAPSDRSLFDDPGIPICDSAKNYRLQGKLAGQDIAVAQFQVNFLESKSLTILVAADGMARTDLALTWSAPLVADRATALSGTSLRVPDDQALAGQSFCVTSGDLGSATPSDATQGRTVVFRLTGVQQGACGGATVESTLKGCVWRSATATFPGG